MLVTGRCLCGAIAYEADINPKRVIACHCIDCQRSSGAPFRTVLPVRADKFKLVKGEPKIFVKTADSGAQRPQAFCADCGTHIYATGVGDAAAVVAIRGGTCDQRDELSPTRELWRRSALSWMNDLDVETSHETS